MNFPSLLAVVLYLAILIAIGVASYRRHQSSNDFILGSRKMNFWLTALAAHASDMSSWIFMGYPAVIYSQGLYGAWISIGLILMMLVNWKYVAPKLRVVTEKYNSLTLPSFFESRFADTSGLLRISTVIISCVFYTIYISAGLVSLGLLIETLFGLPFNYGVLIGICIIVPYLFIGGYVTLAWTDFFQGIFLIAAIVLVPLYALPTVGGMEGLVTGLKASANYQNLIPDTSIGTIFAILFAVFGWGLGYFGLPHIVTKFMGIKNVEDMPKSKWIGISWQTISLAAATLIGLIGMLFFPQGLPDKELVFINMVLQLFPAFFAAFILCAILGATITSMDSMILVLASNLSEDFYKRSFRKTASSSELLTISRVSIALVGLVASLIALTTTKSIFGLVSYAWFGLGGSFGPLVLFSLFSTKVNRYGALGGIISGSVVSGIWPLINSYIPIEVPTLIPGFIISSFTIWAISFITNIKVAKEA